MRDWKRTQQGFLRKRQGRLLALLCLILIALLAPAIAEAAPPSLVAVGHTQQHPTAQWTLPPGVQPQVIEIATQPTVGTDGSFFSENRVLFDLLDDGQTVYTSSDTRLKTGITYYVHINGLDEPCFYASACPVREWSNILTLTIPNVPPNLQSGKWNAYRFLREGTATLTVCDDGGDYRVVVGQTRIRRGRVVARASSTFAETLSTFSDPCGTFNVEWSIPSKLIATGDTYRVTFQVIDPFGLRSRVISGQAKWKR